MEYARKTAALGFKSAEKHGGLGSFLEGFEINRLGGLTPLPTELLLRWGLPDKGRGMEEAARIRRMLLDVIDDCKETPPEQMKIQLLAAGWKPVNQSVWRHPNGSMHMGPYGAWKKMCAEIRVQNLQ